MYKVEATMKNKYNGNGDLFTYESSNRELAERYFFLCLTNFDCVKASLTDNPTGELIYLWNNNDGYIVRRKEG